MFQWLDSDGIDMLRILGVDERQEGKTVRARPMPKRKRPAHDPDDVDFFGAAACDDAGEEPQQAAALALENGTDEVEGDEDFHEIIAGDNITTYFRNLIICFGVVDVVWVSVRAGNRVHHPAL